MSTTDVLIVGAGPTGLALALELSIQNIPFRLIDKLEARLDKSRALAVQSRSQELLNRHPHVADALLANGRLSPGMKLFCNRRHVLTVTFEENGFDDTQFPLPLWISQVDTEAALLRQLEVYGGRVERGVEAKDITQDGETARATLVRGGEEEVVTAKFVVGCDGAHSVVRHCTDVTFEGAQYPQLLMLADAKIKGNYDHERVSLFVGGPVMGIFPLKDGYVRIVGERSRWSKRTGDPDAKEIEDFVLEVGGEKVEILETKWLTSFRGNCRAVDKFRQGRVFLAGDAAHIHSPAGGQGMNTGIQDAINLAWKMAAVLRGEKSDAFLDTYHEERHPVGQHVLNGADRMFTMVASQNFFFTHVRNFLLPWIAPMVWNSSTRRSSMFRFISQLGIKYRRSSIVRTAAGFEGPVRGGFRAPDGELMDERGEKGKWLTGLMSATAHTVLLFSGLDGDEEAMEDAEEKIVTDGRFKKGETVKIYGGQKMGKEGFRDADGALHKRYGFETTAGLAIVRPDGYVEFIGPAESVEEFLSM
ncbi:putative aromatic compound monooxygenase YhjG [Colletotrichum chlorophyti]|uniref:Putative aromatic compound monooxygenase YhjG n=1 Tax=Colletotrichum chlorophyti TaxID=708187 RepID=A0A1Q8RQW5_9PEZI|nr:putative aromatic compound monooxygenase YhjG [Colletotrichum chlorophyti]